MDQCIEGFVDMIYEGFAVGGRATIEAKNKTIRRLNGS
jgi:hypothetical protein